MGHFVASDNKFFLLKDLFGDLPASSVCRVGGELLCKVWSGPVIPVLAEGLSPQSPICTARRPALGQRPSLCNGHLSQVSLRWGKGSQDSNPNLGMLSGPLCCLLGPGQGTKIKKTW